MPAEDVVNLQEKQMPVVDYKVLDASEVVPGAAWVDLVNIAEDTPIDDVGQDTPLIDMSLNNYTRVHLQFQATWPGGPSDNLIVTVQTTLDGVIYDDAFSTFTVDKADTGKVQSFQVENVPGFRVNFKASGATDTINLDTLSYRAQ